MKNNERKVFILFDDMIADMIRNKKFIPIVTEKISLISLHHADLLHQKNLRLNSAHCFIFYYENSE